MNKTPFSAILALFISMFVAVLNYMLTTMASPYIVGDLGASTDISTYTISFFAMGNVLGFPLVSPIARKIGYKRLLVISVCFFLLVNSACIQVHHYPLFIGLRFLLGIFAAPLFLAAQEILFALPEMKEKNHFLPIIALITAVTPVIGACVGGWLSYDYDWRGNFLINIPLLIYVLIFIGTNFEEPQIPYSKKPTDWIGYMFFVLSVVSINVFIIMGQELDWFRSSFLSFLFAVGVVCFLFFLLWELHHENPIVDLSLLTKKTFRFSLLLLFFLFSSYTGMILLLTLWLNLFANYTPIWIAILLGHMALAGMFLTLFVDKWLYRINPMIPLAVALFLFIVSCFHTTTFNVEVNFGRISFSRILAGFSLALFLMPLLRISLLGIPKEKTSSALCFFHVIRILSGGLGASVYTTLWYRRRVFFHERLGEDLTPYSPVTDGYFAAAKNLHLQGAAAEVELSDLLDKQSTALALEDTFYLMSWLMVGLALYFLWNTIYKKRLFSMTG